ncbi:hypothetical protein Gotri_004453 [Gossypium trilobum]|uniref:Uncharacterized protein n=1 Tax=Gossypium trilobum TaxID=34281 RepID=A0A7J9F571_9ROSI|nr:hypothetical protein [Gossypium trilobum]
MAPQGLFKASIAHAKRGNGNGNVEQRRVFPVQSPQVNVRRTGLEQTTNRLPGNRKPTAEI